MAGSKSLSLLALTVSIDTPTASATPFQRDLSTAWVGFFGFTTRRGSCVRHQLVCSTSNCILTRSLPNAVIPVTLPPGSLRLATRLVRTESPDDKHDRNRRRCRSGRKGRDDLGCLDADSPNRAVGRKRPPEVLWQYREGRCLAGRRAPRSDTTSRCLRAAIQLGLRRAAGSGRETATDFDVIHSHIDRIAVPFLACWACRFSRPFYRDGFVRD
jgi:hypothetical protein